MRLKPGYGVQGGLDLHTHTTFSDGLITPEGLVKEMADNGGRLLAVTDHHSMLGVPLAQAEGLKRGVIVIPGTAEISTLYRHGGQVHKVHLLVYYTSPQAQEIFEKEFKSMRGERSEQALASLAIVKHNGFAIVPPANISWMVTKKEISEWAFNNPENREKLENEGIRNAWSFRKKYLAGKAPLTWHNLKVGDVIAVVSSLGGHVAVAHPAMRMRLTTNDGIRWERLPNEVLESLIREGIEGIEVIHPAHKARDVRRLMDFASTHGMTPLVGTDFHGSRLWREKGSLNKNLKLVDEQLKASSRRSLFAQKLFEHQQTARKLGKG